MEILHELRCLEKAALLVLPFHIPIISLERAQRRCHKDLQS